MTAARLSAPARLTAPLRPRARRWRLPDGWPSAIWFLLPALVEREAVFAGTARQWYRLERPATQDSQGIEPSRRASQSGRLHRGRESGQCRL